MKKYIFPMWNSVISHAEGGGCVFFFFFRNPQDENLKPVVSALEPSAAWGLVVSQTNVFNLYLCN